MYRITGEKGMLCKITGKKKKKPRKPLNNVKRNHKQ